MNQPGLINHALQAFPRVRERRSGTPARRLSGKAGREWWKWRWILWDLPEDFAAFSKFDFGQAWKWYLGIYIVPILKWGWIKSYSHPYHPSISPLFKGKKQKFCPSRMVPGPSKRCPSVGLATPPRAFWRKWRWGWAVIGSVGPLALFGNFHAGKNIKTHMERLG
jgi:hypothetical protein